MARASRIALVVLIIFLLLVAVGSFAFGYSMYRTKGKLSSELAAQKDKVKKLEGEREALERAIKRLEQELLEAKKTPATKPLKTLAGKTPVEVVTIALQQKGETVGKVPGGLVLREESNDGIRATVLVGPWQSEFGTAFDLRKYGDEWIIVDKRSIER